MKNTSELQSTPARKAELKTLATLPDDQINTQDIPEQADWTNAPRPIIPPD